MYNGNTLSNYVEYIDKNKQIKKLYYCNLIKKPIVRSENNGEFIFES